MAEDYKPGQLPYPEQDERNKFCKFHYKGVLIVLIPLLFAPILLGPEKLAYRMLYLTICVYLYYVLNVMSQGAIAFIFIVFIPICGITASKMICVAHYGDLIFVTYGSIFTGIMMDASRLSERFAMMMIGICSANLRMLQLVLMLCTAVTSIFTHSAFMAAVWMKIAQAVITEYASAGVLEPVTDEETYEREAKPYASWPAIGIYLTVCYSATLGGMISPFQDPNGIIYNTFQGFMDVKSYSFVLLFLGPMIFGLIVLAIWVNIIFLGLIGGKFKVVVNAASNGGSTMKQAMKDKKDSMGPWTIHSILGIIVMIIGMILLFTRRPLLFRGWDDQIEKVSVGASVPIVAICVLIFAIAANYMFCRYYMCTKPEKEATAPSLVGWKAVNINTPWAHIFMLAASYGFVKGLVDSKLLDLVKETMVRRRYDSSMCFLMGTLFGTVLCIGASGTALARLTINAMIQAGLKLGQGPGSIALPYAAALHNQFLLPCSTPANTIVSGWGNIRPFQFLIGGIVPAVATCLFICLSIALLGESTFSGYAVQDNRNYSFTNKPQ